MTLKLSVAIIAFVILSGARSAAQQPSPDPAGGTRPPASAKRADPLREQRRAEAVRAVQSLADRALTIKDSELKVRTLVNLADILWDRGEDAYARQLFMKGHELLVGMRPSKEDAARPGGGQEASVTADKYTQLLTFLIQKLTRHDSDLARRLSDEAGGAFAVRQAVRLEEDMRQANELLRQGQVAGAAKQAEAALSGALQGRRNTHLMVQLLRRLREKDPKAADDLFLKGLAHLQRQPATGANDLLIIGNYLFTNSLAPTNPRAASHVFISPARVGDTELDADISVNRPDLTPALARAFVGVGTEVLGRPPADAAEGKLKAAAAVLLLPKAQQFNPELASRLAAIAAAGGAAPTLAGRGGATEASAPRNPPADPETALREVEALTDRDERHKYIIQSFSLFYRKGDYAAAQAVADKAQDTDVRGRLSDLARFGEAAAFLRRGQVESAEQAARGVNSGALRRLLGMGVARAFVKRGDTRAAESSLNAVFDDMRGGSRGAQQLYPMLNAVEMLGPLDVPFAMSKLNEVVRAFNELGAKETAAPPSQLIETIRYKDRTFTFQLYVDGVNAGDFYQALLPLVDADSQGAVSAVLELKNEAALSQGLLALSRALLR